MNYAFSHLTDADLMKAYDRINALLASSDNTAEYAKLINQSHAVQRVAKSRGLLK